MLDNGSVYAALAPALLSWYGENRRELPWRSGREPYCVWLSEIMLQQTRVEAVRGYYARFLAALPTVRDLAQADDALLHKLWEGLGYYSRVRNLKKAARVIVEEYGGVFPTDHDRILALPGIGDYTAGAICSICFDAPTPAVDGNVLRLIARLTDDHRPVDTASFKREVRESLAWVYPDRGGDFTQALMELGATLCGPNRKPRCGECPCREFCRGHLRGTAQALPVRTPKREKRIEERTVFILSCGGSFALRRRQDKGLLAGLWEFPNTRGHMEAPAALEWVREMGLHPVDILRRSDRRHIFTHIIWRMRGYYLEVREPTGDLEWFTPEQILTEAALPTAFRQFWEETEHV